ncbi:MAG: response regulator [Deltaproteobacteria bacterium]|nr:response regulator [Deltaproteobacteria bacterium]
MRAAPTPVARSLRRKILQPLIVVGVALSLAGVWGTYVVSRNLVISKVRLRAELLANSLNYAAESISRQGELQRVVTALGAEKEVSLIIVAGGHPARIMASTRVAWLGEPLDTLPVDNAADDFARAVRTRHSSSHYHGGTGRFDFTSPLLLSQPELAAGPLVDGAVIVHLDLRPSQAAIRRLTVEFSLALLSALLLLSALGYAMLNRLVLAPIAKIGKLIEHRHENAPENWSEIAGDDEIGALSRTLDDALTRTDSVVRELRDQKFALDQHAIVAITDAKGKITYVNDNFCAISKYAREQLVGEDYRLIDPGTYSPEFVRSIRATTRAGRVWKGELANRARDGTINWGDTTVVPFLGADGKPFQYVAIRSDTTERKQAEERLHLQSSALESAGNAIVITDRDGAIQWVNPAFTALSGYSWAEAIGRNPRELLKSDLQDVSVYKVLWDTILAGNIWEGELVNRRKNGSLYTERQTITPVRNDEGHISHFIAIKEDVTERLRLEERFRQAEKMEAVGRLAGGIAHDFNNQLFVINGYCDLLADAAGGQPAMLGPIGEIHNAARRSAALTAQLLAFGRKQVLQPKVLDLDTELRGIESMLTSLITEDVHLTIVSKTPSGHVRVDPNQLHQIVMNLVLNALDAMPDGGKLTIETGEAELDEAYARSHVDVSPGKYVSFSISDTGQGMDKQTLARIFEPFFTTKEPGKGTGLGLATVHGIVKQSGGHIAVYSEPGQGTTFNIYLPRVDAPVETAERTSSSTAIGGTETILLVEDEAAVRDVVRRILESHGYRTLPAADGEQGLEIARRFQGNIDLLLTDVVMPGISGPQLAERLIALRPSTRILYMSGYADDAIVRHGLLEPGSEFVPKPCPTDVLLRKVRELLETRRSRERAGRVLIVDDSRDERVLEARLLSRAGYQVIEAASGEEALALLERETVDAVITDVNMTGMDGFGLTDAIRRSTRWQRLPVIILTGACTQDELERSRAAGATACLDKGRTDQQRLLDVLAGL